VNGFTTCGSLWQDVSYPYLGHWSTQDHSVATVDYYATHSGVGVGSTTSNAFGSLLGNGIRACSVRPFPTSGGVNVQVPGSLKVLSINVLPTGTTGDHGCTPTQDYGIELDITYQVLDKRNPAQPLKNATMVPHEHIVSGSQSSDEDICTSRISTCKHTTDANGIWHDAPVGGCFNGPISIDFTQAITIIFNGVSYPVRNNSFSLNTSSVTHGTITNSSDIQKTR
jgi:hypothetical protein